MCNINGLGYTKAGTKEYKGLQMAWYIVGIDMDKTGKVIAPCKHHARMLSLALASIMPTMENLFDLFPRIQRGVGRGVE